MTVWNQRAALMEADETGPAAAVAAAARIERAVGELESVLRY